MPEPESYASRSANPSTLDGALGPTSVLYHTGGVAEGAGARGADAHPRATPARLGGLSLGPCNARGDFGPLG